MNAESSRLRSTGTIESDIRAIWADALVVGYLAATEILLLVGHDRAGNAGVFVHTLVLGAMAAAAWAPGVPMWIRRWAPLIALLFLYSEIPVLLRAAGQDRLFDPTVMRWEATLFHVQPAVSWSTRWTSRAWSEAVHAGYLSYYGIIFAVPGTLYMQKRVRDFDSSVFVLMVVFVACFVCYLLFPVAGPRYVFPPRPQTDGGLLRTFALSILEARSSRGTAFPSSHVAVAVTQTILAYRYVGLAAGTIIGVLTLLLATGAVYGGFHYAVDIMVGAAFGGSLTALALAILSRVTRTR